METKRISLPRNSIFPANFMTEERFKFQTISSPKEHVTNPFLKYDPSLMLANIKAQDHRKHLLHSRKSAILEVPVKKKFPKRRMEMHSLDTEANTASLETLKSLNANYSADLDLPSITSQSSDDLNCQSYEEILENYGRKGEQSLPINKIPLSTSKYTNTVNIQGISGWQTI